MDQYLMARSKRCPVDIARSMSGRSHFIADQVDVNGNNPLHLIARPQNRDSSMIFDAIECIIWLVDNGCDINLVNNAGDTPAHIFVKHNSDKEIDVFCSLIYKGADVYNLLDKKGFGAIHYVSSQMKKRLSETERLKVINQVNSFNNNISIPRWKSGHLSYLGIRVGSQKFVENAVMFHDCALNVSIFRKGTDGDLIEERKKMLNPIYKIDNNDQFWGWTIYFDTPIEYFQGDVEITLEFEHRYKNKHGNFTKDTIISEIIEFSADAAKKEENRILSLFMRSPDVNVEDIEHSTLDVTSVIACTF